MKREFARTDGGHVLWTEGQVRLVCFHWEPKDRKDTVYPLNIFLWGIGEEKCVSEAEFEEKYSYKK